MLSLESIDDLRHPFRFGPQRLKKRLRDKYGSLKNAATFVGVCEGTLSGWIYRGVTPTVESLFLVCKAAGFGIEELMERDRPQWIADEKRRAVDPDWDRRENERFVEEMRQQVER